MELGSDSDSDADSSLMLTADDETFLKDRLPQYLTDDDEIEYDPYWAISEFWNEVTISIV